MQFYVLEQLGVRKIVDSMFLMAGMVAEGADLDDVKNYCAALRRAQADIDIMHQKYVYYHTSELRSGSIRLSTYGASGRASGSCSNRIRSRPTTRRSGGSKSAASSMPMPSAPAYATKPSCWRAEFRAQPLLTRASALKPRAECRE
jgi:hypothetical protein